MARLLLNVPAAAPSKGIINISKYKEESRRDLSPVSGATGRSALVSNFGFTKLKDNATSYILVTGVMGGLGMEVGVIAAEYHGQSKRRHQPSIHLVSSVLLECLRVS